MDFHGVKEVEGDRDFFIPQDPQFDTGQVVLIKRDFDLCLVLETE